MRFAAFRRNPLPRHRTSSHRSGSPCVDGVRRASLLATPIDPPKSSPRSQPYRVTTACSLRAVRPQSGGRPPRFPLPVGGSSAARMRPSTSRCCSANESVASDTLAGTGSLVPSMGLFPLRGPTSPAASLDFPGATRDPRRGTERPALSRWRYTGMEPRTSLPSGRPKPPRESVRRGRAPDPETSAQARWQHQSASALERSDRPP
jgi:hypothetical protein